MQQGLVQWANTWDEAVERAKKMPEGRILAEVVEDTCGDCMRIERLVAPSAAFAQFVHDKVPVRIHRDTPEGVKLAQRLSVDSIPAWVIVTPDLVLCGIQVGSTNQGGWFDTFTATEKSWFEYKKKLKQEQADPGNEELVFDIAQETFKRGGDGLAEPRFRRLAKSAQKSTVREQSLAYLASIELDSDRVEAAGKDLDELLATVTDPVLKERAELRRADVDIARGRRDLAAKRLAEFKKTHPSSQLVKEADSLLQALRTQGVRVED